jgi:phosphohistidine phosphatase
MQMDPTRELTETGKRQAKMMGKWLARQAEGPQLVIESNFQRSISTAKRVADKLDVRRIRSGFLDPENAPENTWSEIKRLAQAQEAERVLVVAHGPLVEKLFCMLIGAPLPRQIHFAHAAIAHFETTGGARGVLQWMVSPNTVARDEDEMDAVVSEAKAIVETALVVAEACAALET